jgi:hypothetical protein
MNDLAIWATVLSTRATQGAVRAYEAAVGGETDHDILRAHAYDGAEAGEAHFLASIADASVRPTKH